MTDHRIRGWPAWQEMVRWPGLVNLGVGPVGAVPAGLSPRSVSDLERGINRTARRDTAELLAGALGPAEPVGPLFVAAARGRAAEADGYVRLRNPV